MLSAVNDNFGALFFAKIDVRANLVAVLGRDQRAHVVVVVGAGTDFERLNLRQQFFEQRLGGITNSDDGRNRHAALAGGAVTGANECVGRLFHIGVRHHDQVILGTAQRLNTRLPLAEAVL